MHRSSERSSSGAEIKFLLKLALRTIPRSGIAALLFLCAGLYMIFPACHAYRQLDAERNIPFETTAVIAGESIALEELMQIEGIERISPVLLLDAELTTGNQTLACEIKAVLPTYPELRFTSGGLFPEASNMPYLILNEAAAQTEQLRSGDTVSLNTAGRILKATICGIFQDESTAPAAYMSYQTAIAILPQTGDTALLLTLSGIAAQEKAAAALQQHGVWLEHPAEADPQWELLTQQIWQYGVLCISFLICANTLLRERRRQEIVACTDEITALQTAGMSTVQAVFPLRIIFATALCAVFSSVIAFLAGTFSPQAVGLCICCVFVHGVWSYSLI